ncbi:transposase InsO family protein [Paraburkholderia atlantica]|uniref:Transposase InsO family protein n=1 Tax=Paraburkholderia youngii TaxID=2782701 RepID=A0A7W8LEN7_9BURK|nr:transposase InsO family protein [Paraburkholderia youngii]
MLPRNEPNRCRKIATASVLFCVAHFRGQRACGDRAPPKYVSIHYTERLAGTGVESSVGTVRDSYDNALAETINGLYKAELIHRRGPWRRQQAVDLATLEWVDWFNNRRLFGPIGDIPLAEAEQAYYRQFQNVAKAA